jgi:hypothetical protein
MKNKLIKLSFVCCLFATMLSCSSEDNFTGQSTVTATAPSLNVSLGFENSQTLVEQEKEYGFTVTLSEKQASDVVVNLAQVSGDATEGEDFSMPHSVTIIKGSLSASGVISIHADELIEETETVTIQIGTGSESNVSNVSGQTVSFNISNLTSGDLAIGMSWAASGTVTDNYGNEVSAYDLADLRLLLTNVPYTQVLDSADGASAESYTLDGAAPDGEYYIVADFYASMSEIPADLDITLTFDQVGSINGQIHSFAGALNTLDVCPGLYNVLAKITKTGDTYAFEEIGQKSNVDLTTYEGDFSVARNYNSVAYAVETAITTSIVAETLYVDGLGQNMIVNFWGEPVTSSTPVEIQLNADGTVVIPRQHVYITEYAGDPYSYDIKGSGNWSSCGSANELSISYDIYYEGDPNGLVGDYYSAYFNVPYLGGVFTLD